MSSDDFKIVTHPLSHKITLNLEERLTGFASKWSSINRSALVPMLTTLRLSAKAQISNRLNEALTAQRAGRSLQPHQEALENLKTPQFLKTLSFKGDVLTRGHFKDDNLIDALDLLRDFAVYVGNEASAYFGQLPQSDPQVAPLPAPTTPAPVTEETPVAVAHPEPTKNQVGKRGSSKKPSLELLRRLSEDYIDRINHKTENCQDPDDLNNYRINCIWPLLAEISLDIRQKKVKQEAVPESDVEIQTHLKNAHDACVSKIAQLRNPQTASHQPEDFPPVASVPDDTPEAPVTVPPVAPVINQQPPAAPNNTPAKTSFGRLRGWISKHVRTVVATVAAAGVAAVAIAATSGLFGAPSPAGKNHVRAPSKTTAPSGQFNKVAKK